MNRTGREELLDLAPQGRLSDTDDHLFIASDAGGFRDRHGEVGRDPMHELEAQ